MRRGLMNAGQAFHLKLAAIALATSTAIVGIALAANEREQSLAGSVARQEPWGRHRSIEPPRRQQSITGHMQQEKCDGE
jgi:hypothetical protein